MLGELFILFFKVGCMAFGGGYAVMSLIQRETMSRGWLDAADFREIGSLAGMAPGSIATNSATLIGYNQAGLAGAAAATAGMVLPSLLLVVVLAAFFVRLHDNGAVKAVFYGLRPVVAALILYAGIHFGFGEQTLHSLWSWQTAGMLLIGVGCLIAIVRYKLHPFAVILLSAAAGIILF
ncbi:chromate transporter [Saccharibacillus kuerlensis]|uniref:Chromate transporter n=1 Tax=Saccharibacillus kuerlensis TaxID=459527 RepID=A0ABQ2KYE0_9BACL|nr:chromate transporter [Saccharibacillus kuerlensis]GGN96979.1 chromate transporter [Saccharibacillus kuerlensis]